MNVERLELLYLPSCIDLPAVWESLKNISWLLERTTKSWFHDLKIEKRVKINKKNLKK